MALYRCAPCPVLHLDHCICLQFRREIIVYAGKARGLRAGKIVATLLRTLTAAEAAQARQQRLESPLFGLPTVVVPTRAAA